MNTCARLRLSSNRSREPKSCILEQRQASPPIRQNDMITGTSLIMNDETRPSDHIVFPSPCARISLLFAPTFHCRSDQEYYRAPINLKAISNGNPHVPNVPAPGRGATSFHRRMIPPNDCSTRLNLQPSPLQVHSRHAVRVQARGCPPGVSTLD